MFLSTWVQFLVPAPALAPDFIHTNAKLVYNLGVNWKENCPICSLRICVSSFLLLKLICFRFMENVIQK